MNEMPKTEQLPLPDDGKPIYLSRTFWASVVTAILPLVFPPAAAWVAANPALYSGLMGAAFTGLRVITKDRVKVI